MNERSSFQHIDYPTTLHTIIEISNTLMAEHSVDMVCRKAVEDARMLLGVERCAIFVYDPLTHEFCGTYGTDRHGQTTDEHGYHIRFDQPFWEQSDKAALDTAQPKRKWSVNTQIEHDEYVTGHQLIGYGWIAHTPIVTRDGKPLAFMFNDAMISGAPFDEQHQDVVAMYCAMIGGVIERKQLESELQDVNHMLERRVEERTRELTMAHELTQAALQETRKSAEALRHAKEEAEQLAAAAKSASLAKSAFLAAMSHEIRTPMNGVIGFTQLLLDTTLTHEQREFTEIIKTSSETLLSLINDILDYSKIESGRLHLELARCDAQAICAEVMELVHLQAMQKGIELNIDAPVPAVMVIADSLRLRQVLLNLIGNAVKFTEAGSVRVQLNVLSAQQRTSVRPMLRISVMDSGIGIAPDKVPLLFSRFMQADDSAARRYGGTGLGLAISRQLMQMMDGSIGVESALGAGSTFWIDIPIAIAIQPNATQSPICVCDVGTSESHPCEYYAEHTTQIPTNEDPTALAKPVLLVEDNVVNQKLAVRMLERLGCQVAVAKNGLEACTMLEKADYKLVLMDCQMPVMDGFTATAQIRHREREMGSARMPIVALTANAMSGDREQCLAAGMDDYIAKPVKHQALADAVSRWIRVTQ